MSDQKSSLRLLISLDSENPKTDQVIANGNIGHLADVLVQVVESDPKLNDLIDLFEVVVIEYNKRHPERNLE